MGMDIKKYEKNINFLVFRQVLRNLMILKLLVLGQGTSMGSLSEGVSLSI